MTVDHTYEIHDMILQQHRGNIADSTTVMDVSRLVSLWNIICTENDGQRHLVSENEYSHWENLRDNVNEKLLAADTDNDIVEALSFLVDILSGTRVDGDSYGKYQGTRYQGMFHARM